MPIYEYICTECQELFEESQKIDDRYIPTEQPCKICGGTIQININPLGFVDPIRIGLRKRPSWLTDRFKEMKKKHPKGNFNF